MLFQRNVKIAFDSSNSEISGVALERLWATTVGSGKYELQNSPFNVYGVSFKDVVSGETRDGEIYFSRVIQRRGHSTFRVKLSESDDHSKFVENWSELQSLGCTVERCSGDLNLLYAIDVPPETNVEDVVTILEAEEKLGVWEYEEAHVIRKCA